MTLKKLTLLALALLFYTFKGHSQEITMFSGFFDYQYYKDDQRIKKKDLVALLETNEEALRHWQRSKTYSTLSWLALASEVGFAINELTDNNNPNNDTINQIGVFGSLAAGITFSLISHNQKKKSILKYNQGIERQTAFKIGPSRRGLGIALQF